MLDGLLNRGFSSKCKSLMKATRTRLEVVRRRAEAKQRFSREDIANLLANGLDIKAYGRTEEFLSALNLLSSYDFIEYTCEYVVKQLSSMQKQRECPEECREAVASLMFAAARFSDFPELRDLRDLFQERYGSTLECFVNQKFVEKLSSRPPVMEKRLQLLKDMASEFSINWESRGFKQRMVAPLAQAKPNKHGSSTATAGKHDLLNGNGSIAKSDRYEVSLKETHGLRDGGQRVHSAREGKDLKREDRSAAVAKCDRHDVSPKETRDLNNGGRRMQNGGEAKESKRGDGGGGGLAKYDTYDVLPKEMHGFSDGHLSPIKKGDRNPKRVKKDLLFNRRQELVMDKHKLSCNKDGTLFEAVKPGTSSGKRGLGTVGCRYSKMSPREFLVRNEDISFANEHTMEKNLASSKRIVQENYQNALLPPPYMKSENNAIGLGRVRSSHHHDEVPLQKPRSVRRKQHKSSSNHDDIAHVQDAEVIKRNSRSRRTDTSRKAVQVLFDDEHSQKDEEERMIDKLLLHYSKKPSNYVGGRMRDILQAHPSHLISDNTNEYSHYRTRDGHDLRSDIIPTTMRSLSLPSQEIKPLESKKFTRVNSFQPDGQAQHVHPKLPDYDDLIAQFAALKDR